MNECVFCEILGGREPASVVYEDETIVAFMTIGPINPGHLLVVPREHYAHLADMAEAVGARLFTVAMRMSEAIRLSGLRCEGINLFLADGAAAFQEVFHVHLHVFPRFDGDDFGITADWSNKPSREELDTAAGRIRTAYQERNLPRDDGMERIS